MSMRLNRLALFLFIMSGLALILYWSSPLKYSYSVSSSPESVISALVLSFLIMFFPRISGQDHPKKPVGHWRRFLAYNIDFFFIVMLCFPVLVLTNLTLEYFATGEWQWSYDRQETKPRDIVGFIQGIGVFYGLYYYFYKHAALNRPTAGQYIMGYRIIANGRGDPKYGERVFHAVLNLAFGMFFIFAWSKIKDGNYQWDKATNTKAVRQV